MTNEGLERPLWEFGVTWRCTPHSKTGCKHCRKIAKPPLFGKKGQTFGVAPAADKVEGRAAISAVGKTDNGVHCPKCGGTQFKAKRSAKGKVIGVATVGVGAVLVPKTRVKCITCGTEYNRG